MRTILCILFLSLPSVVFVQMDLPSLDLPPLCYGQSQPRPFVHEPYTGTAMRQFSTRDGTTGRTQRLEGGLKIYQDINGITEMSRRLGDFD